MGNQGFWDARKVHVMDAVSITAQGFVDCRDRNLAQPLLCPGKVGCGRRGGKICDNQPPPREGKARGDMNKWCQVATSASLSLMALLLERRSHLVLRPVPLSLQYTTINPSGDGDHKARTFWTAPRSSIDASVDDPFECEEG